jgi:3-oxoacyl-[acyl-carrier protein] reductase
MGRMDGRVALITGTGSPTGIGFAAARALGREGAMLAIASTTDRIAEREDELRAEGRTIAGFVADLTVFEQARAMVDSVLDIYGRIDALVNNAGMVQTGVDESSLSPRFHELSESDWDRAISLNLGTAFNVTRNVVPGMIERRYGRIVMVSSATGPVTAIPESVGYGAAKAGMDGLMRGLALEAAPFGVTCNSVAPGWIETGSSEPSELVAGRHTPIGRSGTPEEVASLIVFLAAEESSYVTGRSIVVDGGNTIQEYKVALDGG